MVYTAPNFSFIDAFTNGAKYIDDQRKAQQDQFMQGLGMLGKGAGDAWKWQQRKEAADELERMKQELAKLQEERDQLVGGSVTGSATPNLDTFMGGINPLINTGRI
jgi:hypothetical protein